MPQIKASDLLRAISTVLRIEGRPLGVTSIHDGLPGVIRAGLPPVQLRRFLRKAAKAGLLSKVDGLYGVPS